MTPNGMHSRLAKQQAESEARVDARLDRLEAKLDTLLRAAGISVEVLDADGRPINLAIAGPIASRSPSQPRLAGPPGSPGDALER